MVKLGSSSSSEDGCKVLSPEDECKASVDRISRLPNELLELILSFLTLKEATATSILSRRWKFLWILTPKQDFDGSSLWKLRKSADIELILDEARCKFIRWVDHAVALSYQLNNFCTSLEEFRVVFDLNKSCSEHLDEWLRYALSRKVQRLNLNFNLMMCNCNRNSSLDRCYTFPYKEGNFPRNFKLIKELSIHSVRVSGEALEFFLRHCPLLEHLSVAGSTELKALEIKHTFPSFTCLAIGYCPNLESLVIRDSNIVSFKFSGERTRFVFKNVPLLTRIWVGGWLTYLMSDVVEMFSSVLPQLEMFTIYYRSFGLKLDGTKLFFRAVKMCNLKQLVVNVGERFNNDDHEYSLLPVINLIRASPNLQRFVLEAPAPLHGDYKKKFQSDCATIKKKKKFAHPHLKEMEFVGYRGVNRQFELVQHFVVNAVALENIVVDPRGFEYHWYHPWDRISRGPMTDGEVVARAHGKEQLEGYVHSRINVKML